MPLLRSNGTARIRWIAVHFLAIAVLLSLVGCTKFDMLNATVPPFGSQRLLDRAYGSNRRQKLDVYRPNHLPREGRIVVFFYGGAWQSGEKADYRFVGEALASEGFITVIPDYRVYPEVQFPAFVEDGARAVRWAHDHAAELGGDPQHIFLMGHSAGAHIAAMLNLNGHYLEDVGLDQQIIAGTAALSGPYDFVPRPGDLAVFGMTHLDTPYPAMEPISFVDRKDPPILLIHGRRDEIVEPGNATRLAEKIQQAGGEAQRLLYPKQAHADIALSLASSFHWLAPTMRDVVRFFRAHESRRQRDTLSH